MNLGKLLTKAALTFPNNLAVVHGPKRLTYAQFNARVNRLANALLNQLDIRTGDNVAILQYNYPETLESIFAAFKAGCGAVPINFRLHPREFGFIIDHSESKVVIISPEFNESIMTVRDMFPRCRYLVTLSGAGGELLDYEDLLAAESEDFNERDVKPDDLAWLFYTSGTTGIPKLSLIHI